MGFGDEGNDLQMFATVGLAVAMGNGTPIAKAIHQFVLDVKK
jgi:hydroxymethylpyrimidine pyrophosphatase-like HAD family hydrolase